MSHGKALRRRVILLIIAAAILLPMGIGAAGAFPGVAVVPLVLGLVVVLVALAILWSSRKTFRAEDRLAPPSAHGSPDVRRLQPGGVFTIHGLGPSAAEVDARVVARHAYDQKGWQWFEVEAETAQGTLWLEVDDDDELELSVMLHKVTPDQVGLDRAGLEALENGEGEAILFRDQAYRVAEVGDAVFYRNGDMSNPQKFHFMDFEDGENVYGITFEVWQDGSLDGSFNQRLKPSQVTVFANAGTEDTP